MTDPDDCEIIVCGGGAKPTDTHLASIVHCVDDEIFELLKRRERRRRRALENKEATRGVLKSSPAQLLMKR